MENLYRENTKHIRYNIMNLTCRICGSLVDENKLKKYISTCRFSGEKLIRHKCLQCDVIFGTQRMLNVSIEQFKKEHDDLLLSGYKAPDPVNKEIKILQMLSPQKNKTYLNWGGGGFSTTLLHAKKMGYTLYSYDPYIHDPSGTSEFITDINIIKNMKFDGIISNDLIEHLQNPVEEFIFMRSLLNINSVMIHSTPCYKYCFEWSKFHLFFFEGRSINVLAHNASMLVHNTNNPHIKIFKGK
jgi:hypothetical protein